MNNISINCNQGCSNISQFKQHIQKDEIKFVIFYLHHHHQLAFRNQMVLHVLQVYT